MVGLADLQQSFYVAMRVIYESPFLDWCECMIPGNPPYLCSVSYRVPESSSIGSTPAIMVKAERLTNTQPPSRHHTIVCWCNLSTVDVSGSPLPGQNQRAWYCQPLNIGCFPAWGHDGNSLWKEHRTRGAVTYTHTETPMHVQNEQKNRVTRRTGVTRCHRQQDHIVLYVLSLLTVTRAKESYNNVKQHCWLQFNQRHVYAR